MKKVMIIIGRLWLKVSWVLLKAFGGNEGVKLGEHLPVVKGAVHRRNKSGKGSESERTLEAG